MNCCLIVVDSLRADAVRRAAQNPDSVFRSLAQKTQCFQEAFATECWTLPAHMSMFTGLLPSSHGAHFQTMGYGGSAPTIAEILRSERFHTEVITRNSVFDGTLPGVTRGFQHNTLALAEVSGLNLMSAILAVSKPRFRRQINTSGFFHPLQRESREFLRTFARATVPADRLALREVLSRVRGLRRKRTPFFLFANLYDVHAPYPPTERSIFRPISSMVGVSEAFRMPVVLPKLGGHAYLRADFRISARSKELLAGRYQSAVELMDRKLSEFFSEFAECGAVDDTVLIVTSDHGEAFGEHDLYLHDSSVWQTHLHVPLYIHHPKMTPQVIDDVVSTRDLFEVIRASALGLSLDGTILSAEYRQQHPVAIAEHFFSPGAVHAQSMHRQNLAAAICGSSKVIVRGGEAAHFDLASDPSEDSPVLAPLGEFEDICRDRGVRSAVVRDTLEHLSRWIGNRGVPSDPGIGQ